MLFEMKRSYPPMFELLWKSYPKKSAKEDAFKAFKKLHIQSEAELAPLIKSVEDHKRSKQWQSGVIPHLATYLNQRRWEDEIEELKPSPTYSTMDPKVKDALDRRWEELYGKAKAGDKH